MNSILLLALILAMGGTACGQQASESEQNMDDSPSTPKSTGAEATSPVPPEETSVPHDTFLLKPWTGDLPDMLHRRVIRALVPWSDSYYFLDGAEQRGIAWEATQLLENWLNETYNPGTVKIHVAVLPVRRDLLLDWLTEGRGDVALGGITMTNQRRKQVDFTDPVSKPLKEVLVESADAPAIENLDGLAGKKVHVRRSSSYWRSLVRLNEDLAARGLAGVNIVAADEYLSTEDLMQLVDGGMISYTIADGAIARYWAQAMPGVRVREDLPVRSGARTGWAIRKNSPELMTLLNRFIAGHRQGTLIGNVIFNKYLKDPKRLHNVHTPEHQERLNAVYHYFETHAAAYDFDALMVIAQGFQESRLDQTKTSHRGAVGVMQLLPTTAADPVVGVDDISTAEKNILAGIRYLAWIRDTYLDEPGLNEINRTLMAFASYNAGPSRVRGLRATAAKRGLDPNRWFNNVELVAAEVIGKETVDYVSNIYKYYVAFKLSEKFS